MELEEYMLESAAVELEIAKDEIVAGLVMKELSEGKSVTPDHYAYVNSLVEACVTELSESMLPDAEELAITEDDYVITESGDMYFVDGQDLELIAESVEVEGEVLEEGEKTEEVEAEEVTFTESELAELEKAGYDITELQLTESTVEAEELEGADAIVANVISKLQA